MGRKDVKALADVTDEVIEMFDRCLAEAYARAGHDLEAFRRAMAQATNEKVPLFRELDRTVLDPAITDSHLRRTIYQLEQRGRELAELLPHVDWLVARKGTVRMEKGRVVVSPLEAEERPERVERLEDGITSRLPLIDLPDLLIEVDQWTGFSRHLRHLNGRKPHRRDFLPVLYAALLSQGCNFGFARMAQIAEIPAARLAWCTTWHLREDTLKAATDALVNFHHRLPLSRRWGGGTLSSSDGQRLPVAGKIRQATALRRYFLYQGLTFYSWTSDQLSQYGTKVVPVTIRDATYVLDAILDNATELTIVEHTTDMARFTELVFALFDLLGMQFAPRLRDIGDQQLSRLTREQRPRHLAPRIKGTIRQDFILRHWDNLLRHGLSACGSGLH